uniref:Uncharacterized protein n=1 Tax=Glossina austeni TaxID=7395 RepID=A0A1A9UJC3_GLOAU
LPSISTLYNVYVNDYYFINDQQQQQQQQQHSQQSSITANSNTAQQQQQQSQQGYLSNCCSNMPAMPKEKATAVSLNESNFSELKLKELATSATVAAATAASAAAMATTVTVATTNGRLPVTTPPTANNTNSLNSITQQHNLTTTRQQSLCGCGNASATTDSSMRHKYISNGHSSPLTEAMAAQSSSTVNNINNTPQRNSNTCCRQRYIQSNGLPEYTNTTAVVAAMKTIV